MRVEQSGDGRLTVFGDFDAAIRRSNARGIAAQARRMAAVESLKEICVEIGCSGLSPDMCQNKPHMCGIIRKLVMPKVEGGSDV